MRPGPQVTGRREHARVRDGDVGQRPPGDVLCLRELLLGEHHQRDPRPQPQLVAGRRGRCVPPREVLVVEVDRRQVVRLEVGDPVARLSPDHDPAVDADQVARPVERDVLAESGARRRPGADGVAGELQFDVQARPACARMCRRRPRSGCWRCRGAATAGTSTSATARSRAHHLEARQHVQRPGEARVGGDRLVQVIQGGGAAGERTGRGGQHCVVGLAGDRVGLGRDADRRVIGAAQRRLGL